MKKSRVIITFDCLRSCKSCCNGYAMVSDAKRVQDPKEFIEDADEIIITGGEPMLYPQRVLKLCSFIRNNYPEKIIYIYTTIFPPELRIIDSLVDGIHYTLHAPANKKDIKEFHDFQEFIDGRNRSYRAYLDPAVTQQVMIIPSRWARLEVKPWILEGECKLPEYETIYIYEENNENER